MVGDIAVPEAMAEVLFTNSVPVAPFAVVESGTRGEGSRDKAPASGSRITMSARQRSRSGSIERSRAKFPSIVGCEVLNSLVCYI